MPMRRELLTVARAGVTQDSERRRIRSEKAQPWLGDVPRYVGQTGDGTATATVVRRAAEALAA